MLKVKKLFPVLLMLTAGCNTTTITNLTPKQEFRNANGLYPMEAALSSRQQTIRWESVHPVVVIGTDFYPMRPTSLMTNRWETLVPVPPGNNTIYYRFKFDFEYNAFGAPPKTDSKLSPVYKMKLLDGK